MQKKHKFTDFQTLKILSAHIGHPNNSHKSAMKVAASSPCHGSLFIAEPGMFFLALQVDPSGRSSVEVLNTAGCRIVQVFVV